MQANPTLEQEELDVAVLTRLCESGPWTLAELKRELGLPALDAVMRLVERGWRTGWTGVSSSSPRSRVGYVGSLGLAR